MAQLSYAVGVANNIKLFAVAVSSWMIALGLAWYCFGGRHGFGGPSSELLFDVGGCGCGLGIMLRSRDAPEDLPQAHSLA